MLLVTSEVPHHFIDDILGYLTMLLMNIWAWSSTFNRGERTKSILIIKSINETLRSHHPKVDSDSGGASLSTRLGSFVIVSLGQRVPYIPTNRSTAAD